MIERYNPRWTIPKTYEQAIEHSLIRERIHGGFSDLDLVVQRGPRLETWSSDSTSETIDINDGAELVKSKIIGDSSAPVVCEKTAEAARLASLLSPLLGIASVFSQGRCRDHCRRSPVLDIQSLLLIEPVRVASHPGSCCP